MTTFSFNLSPEFVDTYRSKTAPFGFRDAGGNSVGEITFLRTYSRLKEDGSKETWVDVCERVINGMYSIQKDHCKTNRLPWNDNKAQHSAQDAFDRLFNLKWSPPGRGLWMMGTPLVMDDRNSAALQNCSFVSTNEMTKNDPAKPFAFLMEASMLGIGVGFDDKGADKGFTIHSPEKMPPLQYVIPDTREGWVESVRLLINSYLRPEQNPVEFDYSQIRPAGEPIKTFGGTAAGHEPLLKLHNHIREMFTGREGEEFTRTDIADLGNLIGVCVVSGNVRRSAELLMGRLNDETFINLKNYGEWDENGEFTPGPAAARKEWGWMSNNSVEVSVGDDMSHIIDAIALNGEPGVIWMDVTRKYGRLIDPPTNADHRAAGYNPSLVPGTLVYTTEGITPIEKLENKKFFIRNLNGKVSEAYCWKSGEDKPIHWVNLAGGWSYGATKEHKWPVWDGNRWIKKNTTELQPGDKLPNTQHDEMFPQGTRGTYEEGFLIGWNLGDGWQTVRKDGRTQYGFIVSDEDRNTGIADRLLHSLRSLGVKTQGFNADGELNLSSKAIHDLFRSFGAKHKTEGLPTAVWDASVSEDFRKGLIDALFSSDGTTAVSDRRVCISQQSEKMINDIASLLGFYGVKTSKQVITRPRSEAFPMKYSDDGSTFTRYTLRIGQQDNIAHFSRVFTLSHEKKQTRIEEILATGHNNPRTDTSWYIAVESVTQEGTSDVWDVTVYDETHAFQIDHCVTGNCAEQSLESGECCTLVETYLNRHESLDDFKKTLKVAYLYGKSVTLLPTHWSETNAIMQRNRRIGTSVSGIANFADNHSMIELRTWLNEGYEVVRGYDKVYSEWLGIRESIKVTTVKPSGTVSILAGESPGVHWSPGGEYFLRGIVFQKDDPMVKVFKEAGYKVQKSVYTPETSVYVQFPIHSPAKRSEKDVTIFEKANLAALAQRYWSDNSVSVTLSFDKENEGHHVGTVLHMYDGQLKTVSFLPMGNSVYEQMPYTQITEAEYTKYLNKLKPIDLSGVYKGNAMDAAGEAYCTTDACEIPQR